MPTVDISDKTYSQDERDLFGALTPLTASATWDPASILDGDMVAVDTVVTGAALGDFVMASFSLDVADLVLSSTVTATNTVTTVLANNTGATVNLSSGTLRLRVFPSGNVLTA